MKPNAVVLKEMKNNCIIIFIVPKITYSDNVNTIAIASSAVYERISFVSLNKPFSTLRENFTKLGLDSKNIFFIDAASGTAQTATNVTMVSSPRALTEMSIAINRSLTTTKSEHLIFDSLSTLIAYEQPSTIIKFCHALINSMREKKVKGAFICLKEDIDNGLIKDLSMFVDKVTVLK
jgi:hypothetical protein